MGGLTVFFLGEQGKSWVKISYPKKIGATGEVAVLAILAAHNKEVREEVFVPWISKGGKKSHKTSSC